jgi:hypothetical protein
MWAPSLMPNKKEAKKVLDACSCLSRHYLLYRYLFCRHLTHWLSSTPSPSVSDARDTEGTSAHPLHGSPRQPAGLDSSENDLRDHTRPDIETRGVRQLRAYDPWPKTNWASKPAPVCTCTKPRPAGSKTQPLTPNEHNCP